MHSKERDESGNVHICPNVCRDEVSKGKGGEVRVPTHSNLYIIWGEC